MAVEVAVVNNMAVAFRIFDDSVLDMFLCIDKSQLAVNDPSAS
jgi:hypothetical protein